MSGKSLLANLMASIGLNAAATAAASAVATGKPGLSEEDQRLGTEALEKLVEAAELEGRNNGRRAERERFGAVLTGDAAADHMGLAITLLSTTENTPDQINAALTAAGPRIRVEDPPQGSGTPAGQRQAEDPLKPRDTIASDTPLVDPGAAQPPKEGMSDEEIGKFWGGAIAATNGGGVQDPVWSGLAGAPSQSN